METNSNEKPYSIKGLKMLRGGLEGNGFEAKLLRDGKVIGNYRDDGNGGGADVSFINDEEQDKYLNFIKSKTYEFSVDGNKMSYQTYNHTIDTYADVLIEDYEDNKILKMLETKTLFTLKSLPDNQYFSLSVKYTQDVKNQLIKEYGDDLKEIYNETRKK